jgi:hypothetical protein
MNPTYADGPVEENLPAANNADGPGAEEFPEDELGSPEEIAADMQFAIDEGEDDDDELYDEDNVES